MATYILLSTLTEDGAQTLRKNPERILEVNREVEGKGCKILGQYAVLGPYDFVTVIDAPDNETVARISLELGSRGSVRIISLAAIPVEQFVKKLMEK
ncbi:MAG: GYD domain-containing protein [bacterium JZ-2024 1]